MINKEITNRDIEIYSDSQAVLKSLQKTKIKSRCIKDCSDTLKNLVNKQNTITLKWIPGHRGFEGNERADKLAKEGSQQREDTKPDIKHPHQSLRYIILKEQALSITLKLKNTQINEQNFHIIQTLLEKSKWNIQNITKTTQNLNTTAVAARGWPTLAVVGVCPSCERSEPIASRTLATEQRVARRRGSAAGAGGAASREKFRFLGC